MAVSKASDEKDYSVKFNCAPVTCNGYHETLVCSYPEIALIGLSPKALVTLRIPCNPLFVKLSQTLFAEMGLAGNLQVLKHNPLLRDGVIGLVRKE